MAIRIPGLLQGPIRPVVLAALFVAVATSQARTQGLQNNRENSLEDAVAWVAESVDAQLKARPRPLSVFVSNFDNKADSEKKAGPDIRLMLISQLKNKQIDHTREAKLKLTGEFRVAPIETRGSAARYPGAVVDFQLLEVAPGKADRVLLDSRKIEPGPRKPIIYKLDDVAKLASATAEFSTDPKQASAELLRVLDTDTGSPDVVIDGPTVRPKQNSKFGVQIFAARVEQKDLAPPLSSYRPLTPVLREGVPYVTIPDGEVYYVRFLNDNSFKASAELSIDGIDIFQFSKTEQNHPFWIIDPGSTGGAIGWHREGTKFDTFLVGEYSKDASGKEVLDESKLGQISVVFRAAWTDEKEIPADEWNRPLLMANKGGPPRTMHGPITERGFTNVVAKQGRPRAFVTIRYDRQ